MNLNYTIAEIAGILGTSVPEAAGALRVTGVSTDTRTLQAGDLFFALSGQSYDGDRFVDTAFARGAAAVVTHTPHRSGACLIHARPLEALQRFAAEHRGRCKTQIIAITGSCGKTTAKDMTAAVLETKYTVTKTPGNLNNDIGCPLSLLGIGPQTEYAVIEMGANHPGEIAGLCRMAHPNESAVTMVAPAHLEGFGDLRSVAQAKAEIVEALPADGCFYVNADDPRCMAMAKLFSGDKVLYGKRGDVVLDSLHVDDTGEMVLSIAPIGAIRLPLAVRAHSTNVLLAVAVGLRHHITDLETPLRAACMAATRFKILHLPSRVILDDSYNANPASMTAALEALADYSGKRKIAVLGDMFELGKAADTLHEEVGSTAGKLGVDWLAAIGDHARTVAEAATAAGVPRADVFENHQDIVAALQGDAAAGDVILVKGSRGMKMETVIHLLKASHG